MGINIIRAFWFLMFIGPISQAHSGKVGSWHHKCGSNFCVELVFDKKLTSIKSFSLKHPHRWVLDFPKKHLITKIRPYVCKGVFCDQIRVGARSNNITRLVIGFKRGFKSKSIIKQINNHKWVYSWRFIASNKFSGKKVKSKAVKIIAEKPKVDLRDTIIVIDPGHGGKDPGAIGYNNIQEKRVVLEIAKKLAKSLNAKPGIRAYLTRDRDVYLTLRQRLAKARYFKADCFLAIHADAYWKKRAHGLSIYALSQRGATSEAARWLANRENESELMGGANINVGSKVLSKMLIDFQQTTTVESSLALGGSLLKRLRSRVVLHQKKISQAAFVVLKSPDITSLLIETGFVSNHKEARMLASSSYQNKLVKILVNGLVGYYMQHPVAGSFFTNKTGVHFVKIKPKDSLYSLSRKYKVKLDTIYRYNPKLKSGKLHIGQMVKIVV